MKRFLVCALATAALVASAGPAFAHVTVNPSSASKGGFAKLTFRVPNEKDSANTTAVEVDFPADVTLQFVSVKPTPGWTYSVVKDGDKVTAVKWTGGEVKPGEFQEFDISVGPLPKDKDAVEFKALQTYSDGEVVRWIDKTPAGGEEPEHPAPVLSLTAATGDDHHDAAAEDSSADSDKASSSDGAARGLAVAGIVLGAAGLAFGLRKNEAGASS